MQVNIIITNRDYPRAVFKKKAVILDSYINGDVSSGKIVVAKPILSLLVLAKLVWSLIVLAWPLVVLVVLLYSLVVLVYPLVVIVFPLVVLVFPFVCPLVVLVCPLAVSVCPLVVPVVLCAGLFTTDFFVVIGDAGQFFWEIIAYEQYNFH